MKRGFVSFIFVGLLALIANLSACAPKDVGQEPMTWQEQYNLGVRYLSEGNYEEAIIAFTAAIEIDSKQVLAYVGRGDAYMLSEKNEENLAAAQADYEKVLEIDKTLADVYRKLANVYFNLGESEKMEEILKQGYELTGDENLREALNEMLSELSDGEADNHITAIDFLGKAMKDVVAQYGDDYFVGNYEGSTFLAYWDIATFYFGTFVEYPDNNAVINIVSLYGDEPVAGRLTGAMTYPEIIDAVAGEVVLERPSYYYDEIDDVQYYIIAFEYQEYHINYLWTEDPQTNHSISATVKKETDSSKYLYYEPDLEMITERFERVGNNYLTEVLSIPTDAGFQFANITHEGGVWWSMDCYTPTDNGLRIFAFFRFDPWNDIATITPGWGGDFDAEFNISRYDY